MGAASSFTGLKHKWSLEKSGRVGWGGVLDFYPSLRASLEILCASCCCQHILVC